MKQQITELIDRLASKELTFGCRIIRRPVFGDDYEEVVLWAEDGVVGDSYCHQGHEEGRRTFGGGGVKKILGHPILKGSLAKMIAKKYRDEEFPDCPEITLGSWENSLATMLLYRWGRCEKDGEDKSLQSIFEEAEWVDSDELDDAAGINRSHEEGSEYDEGYPSVEVPKQPHIRELFTFLLQLFPKP